MPHAFHRSALALAVALSLGLAACDKPASKTATAASAAASSELQVKAESARLNAWFETQYEAQLKFSPIQLGFLGHAQGFKAGNDSGLVAFCVDQTDFAGGNFRVHARFVVFLVPRGRCKSDVGILSYLIKSAWCRHCRWAT